MDLVPPLAKIHNRGGTSNFGVPGCPGVSGVCDLGPWGCVDPPNGALYLVRFSRQVWIFFEFHLDASFPRRPRRGSCLTFQEPSLPAGGGALSEYKCEKEKILFKKEGFETLDFHVLSKTSSHDLRLICGRVYILASAFLTSAWWGPRWVAKRVAARRSQWYFSARAGESVPAMA